MEAYRQLTSRSREVKLLGTFSSLLSWDQELCLPPRGQAFRADQMAWVQGRAHRLWTDPVVAEWLEGAKAEVAAESPEAANVARWESDYQRAQKLPVELVETCARVEAEAHEAWKKAREASDYSVFSGFLERLVALNREKAECWGYEECPYDAHLEAYEPGLRTKALKARFEPLAAELSGMVQWILGQASIPEWPEGPYPIPDQEAFNREVMEALGFDFERGRMDTSVHPFSSGMGPHDHRVTTRYDENDFTSSLFGIIHECGHSLYEQGLEEDRFGTPCGESVSLGIHESQSRLWENQIGRSLAFWEYWFPKAADRFPQIRKMGLEDFVRYINRVERSYIRVDASEIGYDLHVILRFEIEDRVFNGGLTVKEIPDFWNERFRELIGIEVPDDRRGCLQDIHWSMGGFGYFPTYTLGSLNAAQWMEAMEEAVGPVGPQLSQGRTGPILEWLRSHVHRHGRRYLPDELMARATGRPVEAGPLLRHFQKKAEWLTACSGRAA